MTRNRAWLVVAPCWFALPGGSAAAGDVPEIALVDVTLEVGDGTRREHATVLLRDGVIAAVGDANELEPPPGCDRIDGGEDTVVTPAFLDLHSFAFTPELAAVDDDAPTASDEGISFLTDIDHRRGLTPRFTVADRLVPDDRALESLRRAGFAAVLATPRPQGWSGRSALVHAVAAPAPEILIDDEVWHHLSLRPPPGRGYPSTLMGVLAHYRQFLADAEHSRRAWERYERRDHAVRRPRLDLDHRAVWPLLDHEGLVAIDADRAVEIDAALGLAAGYGLRPVIVGAEEAWRVVEALLAADARVVLTPDDSDESDPAAGTHDDSGCDHAGVPAARSEGQDGDVKPQLPERVREEQRERRLDRVRNAVVLAERGVPFAFSSRDLKRPGDLIDRVRLAIDEGLDRAAALRALTAGAAEIVGAADVLGRVAPGLSADVAVFDGDPFDGGTLRHLFIAGRRFDFDSSDAKDADARLAATTGLTGTWQVVVELDGGEREYRFVLTQDGDRVTGHAEAASGSGEVADGSVDRDKVRFLAVYSFGERRYEFEYQGTVDGDAIRGTVSINGGQGYPFTARRVDEGAEEVIR